MELQVRSRQSQARPRPGCRLFMGWLLAVTLLCVNVFLVAIVLNHKTGHVHLQQSIENNAVLQENRHSSLYNQQQNDHRRPKIRLLLGIFTRNRPWELERRQLVRDTYLNYFQRQSIIPTNIICSLNDILQNNNEDTSTTKDDCQIAYAFVTGGNKQGPTQRVQPDATLEELTLHSTENDTVVLNIKENMNEGKSVTWFHYASSLSSRISIDYIAKCDTDTLIKTHHFWEFLQHDLPTWPQPRVYAGLPYDSRNCGVPGSFQAPYCEHIPGKLYMAGQLYLLSTDLAQYVAMTSWSSQQDNNSNSLLLAGFEDYDMGSLVHSHPRPIHLINLVPQQQHRSLLWKHGVKNDTEWKQLWDSYVKETNRQEQQDVLRDEPTITGALG